MIYTDLVRKAANISFEAHKNDKDKGGYPYFMHPMTLALQFDDEAAVCVALLHDVIEDHGDVYSLSYLKEQGFPDSVLDALVLLTHDKDVPYLDYVRKIKENDTARRVKLADLKHNSIAARNHGIMRPKYDLYQEAIKILE